MNIIRIPIASNFSSDFQDLKQRHDTILAILNTFLILDMGIDKVIVDLDDKEVVICFPNISDALLFKLTYSK